MSQPTTPDTQLVGVYRQPTDWESLVAGRAEVFFGSGLSLGETAIRVTKLAGYLRKLNDPMVVVELRVTGAVCWYSVTEPPGFEPGGIEFDPFEIRQSHTTDEHQHLCDPVFMGPLDVQSVSHGVLMPSDDFVVLMTIRAFNHEEAIMSPFKVFESYVVTDMPDRLSGTLPGWVCGLD